MYSTTYLAQIVILVAFALKVFKIEISTEELTTIISSIMVLGGALWTLYQRHKKGDINVVGVKTK